MSYFKFNRKKTAGFTLAELLVAMAIGTTVMAGVVQVLVVSKSNFITERELATLQENARFAVKFMSDEIRMAGYNGCHGTPLYTANSINGSGGNWYLDGTGIRGFDEDETMPGEFADDVTDDTDVLVVRRAEQSGLRINGIYSQNSANMPLNTKHAFRPGQIMVVSTPDCQQVGVFQMSGPTNANGNAARIVHNTGNGNTVPGNCTKRVSGNFTCADTSGAKKFSYPPGSAVMALRSQAFYVGTSTVGNSSVGDAIPALFREKLMNDVANLEAVTTAEELVQGVENMQILYGLDNALADNIADIYLPADDGAVNWNNVVTVRLTMRMRSIYPVYNADQAYGVFEGVADTDGSDRYMRQTVTSTIQLRN